MKGSQPVLVVAPNWLGDAVMALPAIADVRRHFHGAELVVAARPSVAPVFSLAPAVDRVVGTGVEELQRVDAGTAILLPNSFGSAWQTRQAGVPERWGYSGNLRGWMLTRSVARPKGKQHQSRYYLDLVRGLGLEALDDIPRMTIRPETLRRAGELLARHGVPDGATIVGFAPGAAYGHAKRWPPARVAELIARVRREYDAVSVIVGAAGDRAAGREIESSLPSDARVVNLIGRTDLRLLAGLLARCGAFVSNDSGAMHLAAACGVPVAAIFGPTDERVTSPLGDHDVLIHQVFCRPCMLRDCPIDHRCMRGVTVDAVFEAVSARLDARAGAARTP